MSKHYDPHAPIPNDSIFREFLKKGTKVKDPLFRFIYLWIAFEWIITTDENEKKEMWDKVNEFCRKNSHLLSDLTLDKRFPAEIEMINNSNIGCYDGGNFRQRLFMKIYKIRSNTFHGSKSFSAPGNLDLLKASNTILEAVLVAINEKSLRNAW